LHSKSCTKIYRPAELPSGLLTKLIFYNSRDSKIHSPSPSSSSLFHFCTGLHFHLSPPHRPHVLPLPRYHFIVIQLLLYTKKSSASNTVLKSVPFFSQIAWGYITGDKAVQPWRKFGLFLLFSRYVLSSFSFIPFEHWTNHTQLIMSCWQSREVPDDVTEVVHFCKRSRLFWQGNVVASIAGRTKAEETSQATTK